VRRAQEQGQGDVASAAKLVRLDHDGILSEAKA
jgi:hypothetical protein